MRMDLGVKARFFAHLHGGGDPDSERVYRWHIDKRRGANAAQGIGMDAGKVDTDDYVTAAKALARSMAAKGFDRRFPIPIDKHGNLMGGAHRTACAIALDCDAWVQVRPGAAWAPQWGRQWFIDNGMESDDQYALQVYWDKLCARRGYGD